MADDSFMDRLGERQRDVFGQICIGQDQGHNPRTLAALAQKGLIKGYRETLSGHPPVVVTRWEVPIAVHVDWAEWCARQPDGAEVAP